MEQPAPTPMPPAPPRRPQAGLPREVIIAGPILPVLARLAGPIVASNLIQSAYDVVNMFWLGRLGSGAVAAVALGFPVFFLVTAVAFGFSMAGTALLAQRAGAGDRRGVNRVAAQTTLLTGALSLVLGAAGVFLTRPILLLMATPAAVLPDATIYLQIFLGGLPVINLFLIFAGLLRGWGDTVTPLKLQVVSIATNALLDPALIFGVGPVPAMGVAGAAWATLLARLIPLAAGFWILFRGTHGVRLEWQDLRHVDWPVLRQIFRIGTPSALEMGVRAVEFSILTGVVARFGQVALAAFGLGSRLLSLGIIPAMAVAMAATTMVGQNLGADRPRRALASGWTAAGAILAVMTAAGLLVMLRPDLLVRAFTDDGPLLAEGARYLAYLAPSLGCQSMAIVLTGALRGAGRTMAALVLSVAGALALRFPLAVVLAYPAGLGLPGIWLGMSLASVLGAGMTAAVWWAGRQHLQAVAD